MEIPRQRSKLRLFTPFTLGDLRAVLVADSQHIRPSRTCPVKNIPRKTHPHSKHPCNLQDSLYILADVRYHRKTNQQTMFTPVHTSLGALLLYLASSSLLLHNGAVFGISSLLAGCVFSPNAENVPIVAGLVSSLFPVGLFAPSLIPLYSAAPTSFMSFAPTMGIGYCIGWGTKVCDWWFRRG